LLAALNRFKVVTDQYQTTTHSPEALHREVEIYVSLGLKEDAKRTAAVLGYNFPGSDWYQDSYELLTKGRSASVPAPEDAKKGKKSGWLSWLW
jgi:outer membrane protein assembly factor BamD